MANKRQAMSQLTADNWDQEEEAEERGKFAVASEDVLKNRVFKSAKRRMAGADAAPKTAGEAKGIFSGFGGLGGPSSGGSSVPSFGSKTAVSAMFANTKDPPGQGFCNVESRQPTKEPSASLPAKPTQANGSKPPTLTGQSAVTMQPQKVDSGSPPQELVAEFMLKLKGLNDSFKEWMCTHLSKDQCCILTSSLKDYKRHVEDIQKQCGLVLIDNKLQLAKPADGRASLTMPSKSISSESPQSFTTLVSGVSSKLGSGSSKDNSSIGSQEYVKEPVASDKLASDKPTDSSSFGSSASVSAAPFSFGKATTAPGTFSFGKREPTSASQPFSFGGGSAPANENARGTAPTFSFGKTEATAKATFGPSAAVPMAKDQATIVFGKPATSAAESTSHPATSSGSGPAAPAPFSFGTKAAAESSGGASAGSGFSFAGAAAAASTANTDGSAEEPYEPPKPEVTKVVEEDALYTKRVKLFYQKSGRYIEKGLGNLFVKPLSGGNKFQLLIRADTNLGNILLNVVLSKSMAAKREGKNNVTLLCVPNPPMEASKSSEGPAPVLLLIRVKTGEDADELIKTLEEYKR